MENEKKKVRWLYVTLFIGIGVALPAALAFFRNELTATFPNHGRLVNVGVIIVFAISFAKLVMGPLLNELGVKALRSTRD